MKKYFNNSYTNKKGFTIIELIVVIAIIAVMAAIVLVNVNGFTNKGKDAAAKANLNTLLNYAILYKSGTMDRYTYGTSYYFSNPGQFSPTCNQSPNYCCQQGETFFTNICNALTASNMGYTLTTYTNGDYTKWCASVPMKADTTQSYCVDSTGNKKMGAGETCASGACP